MLMFPIVSSLEASLDAIVTLLTYQCYLLLALTTVLAADLVWRWCRGR